MSGSPAGGSTNFNQRLKDALTRAKTPGSGGAGGGAAPASTTATSTAPPSDAFNDRLAGALRTARGEPVEATDSQAAEAASTGPVGQGDYTVRQGDCMASIAVGSGHFWETIWDDPANSELKEVRQDPYVLLPGDRVTIPELRRKDEDIEPEKRHRFVRKGAPEKLIVVFRVAGEPRANEAYSLDIDGVVTEGTTDPSGRMEAFIPPDAREGWITFVESGDMYELELGHLDPVNEIAGVQGRLRNLGFYAGSVDGRPGKELSDAVLRFQEDAGLPPTGTLSEAGRRKLQEVHGS
jgi:N-acetylmuramoyl-L-alanine amidase